MRWRIFGVRKKKEFYTEGAESTEVTEKRSGRQRHRVSREETRKARRARRAVPLRAKIKLWREAEGFVFCVDPDVDYFCFLAFFGVVVGDGHGREGANRHADFDAGG
jgi:hypothetical protein